MAFGRTICKVVESIKLETMAAVVPADLYKQRLIFIACMGAAMAHGRAKRNLVCCKSLWFSTAIRLQIENTL